MKNKRVLVIGLGRMGQGLIEELWDTQVEILAVDMSAAAIDEVKDKTAAAFVGDGSDQNVLASIGARELDVAVVTYGEDFEATALAVSSLAQMKLPTIIARAATERQANILYAIGATRVVRVENEMGRRLAAEVLSPASSAIAEYAADLRVVPWLAAESVVGKTLRELDLRAKYQLTVVGFCRGTARGPGKKPPLLFPEPDMRIEHGDTLLVIGASDAVEKFLQAH